MSFLFSTRRGSSLVLLPSLPRTPRRHRQADDQPSSLYPPSPSFSSFDAASVRLCCLSHPSLVRNTRTVVSSMSDICRRRKGRFALNMKIKSAIIFLRADSDGHSLNPTIVEGPIGRHKSRLPSRETDDGLTGTYSRGTWTGPNRCWYGRESGVHVQA